MSSTTEPSTKLLPPGVPPTARILTYAGVIPFIAGFLVSLFGPPTSVDAEWAILFFKGYAAVILAFLGGVHWGFALTFEEEAAQRRGLTIAVIPPLIGAVALVMDAHWAFVIFAIAFAVQGAFDIFFFRKLRRGGWYARLRLEVTTVVVILLALSAYFT